MWLYGLLFVFNCFLRMVCAIPACGHHMEGKSSQCHGFRVPCVVKKPQEWRLWSKLICRDWNAEGKTQAQLQKLKVCSHHWPSEHLHLVPHGDGYRWEVKRDPSSHERYLPSLGLPTLGADETPVQQKRRAPPRVRV
jgi:hypothetical protein